MDIKERAYKAVDEIVFDITCRSGIGNDFRLIDQDVKEEMLDHWKDIIIKHFEKP